jgi:excisionase family DNA binding protein
VRNRGRSLMITRGVTVQEAAAYLSTTVSAIRRLIFKSELPFTKLGKRFIIDRQDLDKWIEEKTHRMRGETL